MTLAWLSLNKLIMHRWLAAVALDWAVIAASLFVFAHWPGVLTGLAGLLLVGNRQHAIAILGHDGAHGLVCQSQRTNDALTKLLCFWPLGISLRRYRQFHFAHHKFVGTALDPELALKLNAAPAYDLPAGPRAIVLLALKDFLVWPVLRETVPFLRLVGSPLAAVAVWGLAYAAFGWMPVALWFLALSTSFWAVFRLRIWTEHQGTLGTHRVVATWWQRLVFLPHNTWCHFEHHAYPGVPFYALPAMRTVDGVSVSALFRSYG